MKVISLFKNENKLIARAAENSREAQEQLYKKYSPKMLGVCRQYIKDIHFAEEVMLNGFFKVFTNIKSFKNEGSFEGWIRKIMVREAISYLRSHKNLEFLEDNFNDYSENTVSIGYDVETEHLQKIIDSLPEGYKTVLIMHAVEGYKHQEIAKMLNITEGTSKSQLFKAKKMLQEQLTIKMEKNYGTT